MLGSNSIQTPLVAVGDDVNIARGCDAFLRTGDSSEPAGKCVGEDAAVIATER